jgi:hypothetical protein
MTYRKSFFTGLLYLFAAFGLAQLMSLLLRMAQPYMPTVPAGRPTGSSTGWFIAFSPLQFFAFLLAVFAFAAIWEYFRLRRKSRNLR